MNQRVTVHQAAEINTEVVAKPKPQYETVIDAKGRNIRLRRLTPLDESRLILAVGPENAANTVYLNTFVVPAAMVAYIDGEPYGQPGSIAEIEMVLDDLDTEACMPSSTTWQPRTRRHAPRWRSCWMLRRKPQKTESEPRVSAILLPTEKRGSFPSPLRRGQADAA